MYNVNPELYYVKINLNIYTMFNQNIIKRYLQLQEKRVKRKKFFQGSVNKVVHNFSNKKEVNGNVETVLSQLVYTDSTREFSDTTR